jgi:hypothetical protein
LMISRVVKRDTERIGRNLAEMQGAFEKESILAVGATPIKIDAGASIERNLLGDLGEHLRGIGALIALDGALGLGRQIPICIRLGAAGAFNDIEFGL